MLGILVIDPPDIYIGYCNLEFNDVGVPGSDPMVRTATAQFLNPDFCDIVGVSGSPVLNETANVLCGMVVRGGMVGNDCSMYYIDIADVLPLLNGIDQRASNVSYSKASPFTHR